MVRGFFIYSMNLDYSKLNGVLPAVIQDATSGRVLMVGFMNEEAFRRTIETGHVTFFSRSRKALWVKGETSGHRLVVREVSTDCDKDSLLIRVDARGPGVCHEGYQSCFYRKLEGERWVESEAPTFDPRAVYGGVK
jgi:phosphoribosyl-AMP cyclohydrolase